MCNAKELDQTEVDLSSKMKKFLLVTPSNDEYLDLIRDFVGKIASTAGFGEEDVNKIQLSVDEACTNVMKHAYKSLKSKDVQIEVELNLRKFVVSVIDKGSGFQYENIGVDDMDAYLSEFRKGGLGLHLIKVLMDDVQFSIQPAKKNVITMTKYIGEKSSSKSKNRKLA